MEVLDLNSENKAGKKGIADDIYLKKNAETGLPAALLEPSLNEGEGVMRSEDSNKEESKYIVIDIVQESEEEVDPLIRCCSCFSFFIPLGSCFNLFRIFGKKHEEDSQKPSLAAAPRSQSSGQIEYVDYSEAEEMSISLMEPILVYCPSEPCSQSSGQIEYEDYSKSVAVSCLLMEPILLECPLEQSSDCAYNGGSFGDDLINEFKPPVKHVDLPRSNGS